MLAAEVTERVRWLAGGRGRTTTKDGWFTSRRCATDCDWSWNKLQTARDNETNG